MIGFFGTTFFGNNSPCQSRDGRLWPGYDVVRFRRAVPGMNRRRLRLPRWWRRGVCLYSISLGISGRGMPMHCEGGRILCSNILLEVISSLLSSFYLCQSPPLTAFKYARGKICSVKIVWCPPKGSSEKLLSDDVVLIVKTSKSHQKRLVVGGAMIRRFQGGAVEAGDTH